MQSFKPPRLACALTAAALAVWTTVAVGRGSQPPPAAVGVTAAGWQDPPFAEESPGKAGNHFPASERRPAAVPRRSAPAAPARAPRLLSPPVSRYGPPAPAEWQVDQQAARTLLAAIQSGALTLVEPARDGSQLEQIARCGALAWPAPAHPKALVSAGQRHVLAGTALPDALPRQLASRSAWSLAWNWPRVDPADSPDFDPLCKPPSSRLMLLLVALAAHSTPRRPLELLSLMRPPYPVDGFVHVGPVNPHSLGLAVDISSYGGFRFDRSRPEDCVRGAIRLLQDLPPGRYRLGMLKAPDSPLIVGRAPAPPALALWLPDLVSEPLAADSSENSHTVVYAAALGCVLDQTISTWPFFPAPEPLLAGGLVQPEDAADSPLAIVAGRARPRILKFKNECYASPDELGDARLKAAIEAAARRGVNIVAMFPDGSDHIHVDVRQLP